ncbi:inner membrane protein [Escherichia coli]|nr:inner membrane protein [Escherichia coli]
MSKEHTTEHLRAELKSLSDTLEEVLSSSGEKSKEELSKIRSKAEQALKQSRYRLGETGDAIAKQTRVAAARADEYVRENPWTGVGIGAAIGVVLGVSAVASLIMADTHHAQGPGKSVLGIGQRIVSIMVEMVETRLRLAVVELEEEKANLFQLLLMLGLTMLFAAFGLMSLMVLIIWAVDPQYRLNAMIATTVVLLLLALIGGIWTLRKSRKSTLLRHTRHELANDRQLLEEESREQ